MKTALFKGIVKTTGKDNKVYENEKAAIVGRVVRAPHVSEKAVTIDVATVAKEAEFIRVIIINEKQREVAAKWLQKGAMVAVVGNHKEETYPKKDGSGDGQRDIIYADSFQICQFAKTEGEVTPSTPTVTPATEDDDLPF